MWQSIWNSRNRTLLLLIPPEQYARQEVIAHSALQASTIIDWREEFFRAARPTQRHLGLSAQGELARVKGWTESQSGAILCVINTEYALTRLSPDDRQLFWRGLWSDFPYSKSIFVYTVLDSRELLPETLDQWEASNRVLKA